MLLSKKQTALSISLNRLIENEKSDESGEKAMSIIIETLK